MFNFSIRTGVNMYSHGFSAVIAHHLNKKNIEKNNKIGPASSIHDHIPLNHIHLTPKNNFLV